MASCQADRLNFSTQAFSDFATRGMKIKRACNPEGPGLRGLITANVVERGRVARGALALATINAPAGTRFTSFRWAGTVRRRDCRYALQLYADAPDAPPIALKNVRANQRCPRPRRAQAAGYRSRTFNISGATRVVQRVICVGGNGRKSCSARGSNYIRTYKAEVGIADTLAPDRRDHRGQRTGPRRVGARDPAAQLRRQRQRRRAHGPSGRLRADRRHATAPVRAGVSRRRLRQRRSMPERPRAHRRRHDEPSQRERSALVVQAQDTAGNTGTSAEVTARIDNSPPGRVEVGVVGGQGWRNSNSFAVTWANPPENDRAPIVAAGYKLCAAGGGRCSRGEQTGPGIARLGVQVPSPGVWTLSLWRRDAAGNETEAAASVPVTLRYDPEAPQLGFEPSPSGDPTLVSVQVTDRVSGLADGSIEISREGSNTWQALATQKDASRLVARIDDAALPAGSYLVRATAHDQARNEASTDRRLDGQPMVLALPLRIVSTMQAGVRHDRIVRRTIRRHGKRRQVRRRVTELRTAAGVRFGQRVKVIGRLANRDGQGIAGAEIQVLSRSSVSPEQLVAVLHTDSDGRYGYTATGSMDRTLRFAYAGSPLILPTQSEVRLGVPAVSSLRVSRRRVLNGQAVTFAGRLRTLPVIPGGKLVELQVRLSKRWQTFRTTRTDPAGRWAIRYRFKRTRGEQRFRFRVGLPREAGYPFGAGASRSLTVRVRGVR